MLLAALLLATIFPCKPGTAEHAAATKTLEKISSRVASLDPAGDPKPLWKEIESLGAIRCFEGSGYDRGFVADPESALALKEWWDAGGHHWLGWYLRTDETPRRFVAPPDMRKALTAETPEKAELAPILCPADRSKPCGAETRGWAVRARDAFRLHAFENGRARKPEHGDPLATPTPFIAIDHPNETVDARWNRWREHAVASRDRIATLPLGRTRAPSDGWLVVRGRRGHYSFCDEVRVYDLATGAAWIAQSCSGLVLREDGSVDGKKTDDARKPKARAGAVSIDAIREAAWMTLLSTEILQPGAELAEWIDIPEGVVPAWPSPDDGASIAGGGIGLSFWSSSAQTRLSVTWKRTGGANVERELTWPDSTEPGAHHAAALLAIADLSFVEGCPPAALPATVASKTSAPGVGSLDAPTGVAGTQDMLVQALLELAPCGAK